MQYVIIIKRSQLLQVDLLTTRLQCNYIAPTVVGEESGPRSIIGKARGFSLTRLQRTAAHTLKEALDYLIIKILNNTTSTPLSGMRQKTL